MCKNSKMETAGQLLKKSGVAANEQEKLNSPRRHKKRCPATHSPRTSPVSVRMSPTKMNGCASPSKQLSSSPAAVPNVFGSDKYNSAPSPGSLPKPPTHWFSNTESKVSSSSRYTCSSIGSSKEEGFVTDVSNQLKMMLKVQG